MFSSISWPAAAGFFPAACLAAAIFGATPASATQFRGGGFISDFSSECMASGWGGIQMLTSRYRPSDLPDNGSRTRLTLMLEPGTLSYATEGRFSGSFSPVDAVAIYSGPWQQVNPQPRLRLLPGSSINIGAGTSLITLNGEVRDFDEIAGCNMRFRVYLSRHN